MLLIIHDYNINNLHRGETFNVLDSFNYEPDHLHDIRSSESVPNTFITVQL